MDNEYRGNAKHRLGKHWNAKPRLGNGSAKLQLGNEGPERLKPSWSLAFPVG